MSTNTILASAPLTATGYHLKATGTTLGQSLIWDNGTNVGIGNTNTTYTLDVSGSLRSTNTAYFATTSGVVGIGTTSVNASTILAVAGSNTVTDARGMVSVNTTNASAADLGGSISLGGENGLGTSPYAFAKISGRKEGAGATYSGYLSLATTFSDGTITERMRITSAGNVGIGTSSPGSPLDVVGTIRTRTAGSAAALLMQDTSAAAKWEMGYEATSNNFYIYSYGGGTSPFRITSGGNVNINGTGFSDVKFYVKGSDATSSNYAALFVNGSASNLFNIRNDGAVQVFGSLSKGSGSFRIDHPLESMTETHQLVHSFIEGPRVDLIYRGKLTLVNGKAEANIDEMATMTKGTFEALCREVQCFTTNESGWDLVKGKVIGNIIYIESQNVNSTDEISWMVIGERKDKHILDTDWTDDNGKVIVEPLKPIEPTEPITN